MSKKEEIEKLLSELNNIGGVSGSAVISRDGLLIASQIPEGIDAETLAAMTATMVGAAETASTELKQGLPERVLVETKTTKLISVGAGTEAILVAITESTKNLGLILLEIGKTSEKIKSTLGE